MLENLENTFKNLKNHFIIYFFLEKHLIDDSPKITFITNISYKNTISVFDNYFKKCFYFL